MKKGAIKKYFIDSLSYMALGLFASLIISLIINQLSLIPFLGFLNKTYTIGTLDVNIISIIKSNTLVGAAIGVAVAYGLKADPLVIFSSAASGAIGYIFGGPLGAYIATLIGEALGRLVSKKTIIDIVLTPIVVIVGSSIISVLIGPYITDMMNALGNFIEYATTIQPFFMGIIISVVIGMALTAPISSAAICIMLGMGLSAGAATVGCCAQMVGFALMSFKDNKWNGLFSIGIGTSMLQFSNIVKKPLLWLPTIIASAIMGPLSTMVFMMENTPSGAAMGKSGLVGLFGAYEAMGSTWIYLVLKSISKCSSPWCSCLIIYFDYLEVKFKKVGDLK